jgi:hypothetical protein
MAGQTRSCHYCMGTGKSGGHSPSWCVPCSGTGYLTTYSAGSRGVGDGGSGAGGGSNIVGVLILLGLAWFMLGSEADERLVPRGSAPQSQPNVRAESRPAEFESAEPPPVPAAAVPQGVPPTALSLKAEHKHSFGKECHGTVEITADEFSYRSDDHPLFLSRSEISKVHESGFEDRNGKKWHFRLEGLNADEIETLLSRWLSGEDVAGL